MSKEFEGLERCDICDGFYVASMFDYHCGTPKHVTAFERLANSVGL
jgi:hypothetical protein